MPIKSKLCSLVIVTKKTGWGGKGGAGGGEQKWGSGISGVGGGGGVGLLISLFNHSLLWYIPCILKVLQNKLMPIIMNKMFVVKIDLWPREGPTL